MKNEEEEERGEPNKPIKASIIKLIVKK